MGDITVRAIRTGANKRKWNSIHENQGAPNCSATKLGHYPIPSVSGLSARGHLESVVHVNLVRQALRLLEQVHVDRCGAVRLHDSANGLR